MNVDENARRVISTAIENYLDGRIDNFSLDNALCDTLTDDVMCHEIAKELWFLYDDCSQHKNVGKRRINDDYEVSIRRWVTLLRSSSVWQWAVRHKPHGFFAKLYSVFSSEYPNLRGNAFWPWSSEQEWNAWIEANSDSSQRTHDGESR